MVGIIIVPILHMRKLPEKGYVMSPAMRWGVVGNCIMADIWPNNIYRLACWACPTLQKILDLGIMLEFKIPI